MPGMEAASRYAELRRQEAGTPKVLYAVDARLAPSSPAAEIGPLTEASVAAVRAGGGHVLETSHVVFPNGAVTLVLILAESHLSIHTWPEEDLIAIDLFSCGAIDGQAVVTELVDALGLQQPRVTMVDRGRPLPGAG
ncbi:MAG TPA: S-adenosylmethionine decarboxylase [Streptosporangiaceae bacterium]